MQYQQPAFKTVRHHLRHHPHWMQFVINEFIPLCLCLAAFAFAGMEDMPFKGFILQVAFLLVLFILYKFAYLKHTVSSITMREGVSSSRL